MSVALPIVLIGPDGAGKRTAGKLIAERLEVPFVHTHTLDAYLQEIGFNEAEAQQTWRDRGFEAFYIYMQPYCAHLVERVLADHSAAVIVMHPDCVALSDPDHFARVQRALGAHPNVIFLSPCPDEQTALDILEDRQATRVNGVEINEYFARHHCNHELAKHTVFTENRTPEETCAEIVALLEPHDPSVILIGPMGTGKSTQGRLLAAKLGREQAPLDELRWDYYKEIGWNQDAQRRISEREGFAGVYRYWKPLELHAVERVLLEHRGKVIDFGAGHSVQDNEPDAQKLLNLLSPFQNVILLLPSADLDRSVQLLRERGRPQLHGMDAVRFRFPYLHRLSEKRVYNAELNPEETRDTVLGLCEAA